MAQKIILSSQKIPKLRFREFGGEWEEKKIGEFAPLQRGFDLPSDQVEAGEYPIVYSNGILRTHSTFKATGPGVVTGRSGTIGKVTYVEKDYWPHNTSLWVTNFYNNCPKYVYYFYKNLKLEKFGTGSGVPTLNRNDVHAQKRYFPSLPEQQKIASFLSSIDLKIEKLRDKKLLLEQFKKGVIQKIFSQEIRFKDENGENFPEWEEQELGSLLEYEQPTKYLVESQEYNNQYSTPVLTAGKTFILGYTNEETGVFNKGLPVIIFDDFTTATQFVDFPFKAKSSAMKILRTINGNSARFLYEILRSIDFQIGGHGRHWISIFAKMSIVIPSIPEQQKIASFLSEIDAKIESTSTQIKHAEKWKKGLLQQMFI